MNTTYRTVLYMAAPLRPTPEEIAQVASDWPGFPRERWPEIALHANIARGLRWLRWLRRSFPRVTFIAPWIAGVLSGEDDNDEAQREAGLVDADAVVPRLTGVALVAGRISSGMQRERLAAHEVVDLTHLGVEPPAELYDAAKHGPVPALLGGEG